MKTKKTPAATKRGVVLESVVRRPRPSLFPQKVRGGITEAWYYEYADHLEFYHHDGPGKVSTFSVPLWMLQKSLARCKPNPKAHVLRSNNVEPVVVCPIGSEGVK